jgi:Xaa-Pro dipeptidase
MDFGASYQRYASDITRTVVVGRARREHREVYGTVHRAQEEARSVAREGVLGRDVDRVAREIIDSSPYRGRFIHSVGHSLGLAVHDGAVLNSTSDLVLKRNMVFTVEPGIYLPGKGGVRIEDDVVVRAKGGPEVMTSATRELLEVG